jgi:predicted O-methyltransferase YrrM
MTEEINQPYPSAYLGILEATQQSGFNMASDILTCSLLRTIAASKPSGSFLELGTGTGLSATWILDGMDQQSTLLSIDNDQKFLDIAAKFLGNDDRLQLIIDDGGNWLETHPDKQFDFIFADTWHGKYLMIEQALAMLKKGGWYIIDDMLPQPNWPEGHAEKAENLEKYLDTREDLLVTKMKWATGIMIAVKR